MANSLSRELEEYPDILEAQSLPFYTIERTDAIIDPENGPTGQLEKLVPHYPRSKILDSERQLMVERMTELVTPEEFRSVTAAIVAKDKAVRAIKYPPDAKEVEIYAAEAYEVYFADSNIEKAEFMSLYKEMLMDILLEVDIIDRSVGEESLGKLGLQAAESYPGRELVAA